MPTYVYRCKACEHQFETIQKMTDKPLTECPECGGEIARLLFPVGIVFKGSGFHINDYPSSKASSATASAKKDDTGSEKPEKKDSEPAAASTN